MRAMILAAGLGTRLRPLTDTVPKPLIEVAGRPMIAFSLQLLRDAGIEEVVINLHHLGQRIREELGDGSDYGVRIHYSVEDPILDTGGGIAAARRHLQDDSFVLLNSDVYIEIDLRDMIDFHRARGALVTMLVRPDPDALRKDDVGLDAAGRVRRILGHGVHSAGGEPLRRHMYASAMVLEPGIFRYLPGGAYSLTRDVLPRVLEAGELVFGYVHQGYWRVLDTHDDLAEGRKELGERLRLRQSC
jgi:NDP-sugar pyrophosphorylase family protein